MREIKFRMWSPETKVMVDLKKITPLAVHADLLNENLDGLFIPFKEGYHLMQFTGLLDKNGKEIYEGDIVQGCKIRGIVEYYIDCFRIYGGFLSEGLGDWGENDREIIGNIYENPELIEVTP
jgi:uncharacterized phage protein (TIGR01671 family)